MGGEDLVLFFGPLFGFFKEVSLKTSSHSEKKVADFSQENS